MTRPGIDRDQLLTFAIQPAHTMVSRWVGRRLNTRAARQLSLVTAAVESHCGQYLKQVRGPAAGPWQMEKPTYRWVVSEIMRRDEVFGMLHDEGFTSLYTDLMRGALWCRLRYFLVPAPLPEVDNVMHMWVYYKTHWNSHRGATTRAKFVKVWDRWDVGGIT